METPSYYLFSPSKKDKIRNPLEIKSWSSKGTKFDELWNRKRKSSLTSYPIYILGREDLFLFLVSHGARHGWSRLRWLMDIHQMVKQKLDWPILINLLKKYHYLHVGGQALILSSQLLKTH